MFSEVKKGSSKDSSSTEKAIMSISQLRNSIYELLQQRSLLTIHLAQYQNDYQKMHDMYNKYKQRLQSGVQNQYVSYDMTQQMQQHQIQPQMMQYQPQIQPQLIQAQMMQMQMPPPPPPPPKQDIYIQQIPKTETYQKIDSKSVKSHKQQIHEPEKSKDNKEDSTPIPTPQPTTDIKWSVQPGKSPLNYQISLKYSLNTGTVVTTIRYDPTGKYIAFADNRNLQVIHASSGALYFQKEIPHPPGYCDIHTRVLRFSPDGKIIAVSTAGSQVAIFSMQTRAVIGTLDGHTDSVSAIAFLSDNKTLITGGYDGNLFIWDLNTMKYTNRITHGQQADQDSKSSRDNSIISLAVTQNDELIAVGFMNSFIGIYEPTFKQAMQTFKAHDEYILSVTTVPRSRTICTTSHDGTAKIWDLNNTQAPIATLVGHKDFVICSSFSPNQGDTFAITGSKDETIKGWNYATGDNIFTISAYVNSIFSIDHHPTEKSFVSCSGDGVVCVWDYTV